MSSSFSAMASTATMSMGGSTVPASTSAARTAGWTPSVVHVLNVKSNQLPIVCFAIGMATNQHVYISRSLFN